MAPIFSYGQSIIDEYNKQRLVEEYLKERGQPVDGSSPQSTLRTRHPSPSSPTSPTHPTIFSWTSRITASASSTFTGPASPQAYRVLAVVLVGLAIASCCYFRGRRQRQARSRHSQLLHTLSSTSSHVSTPVRQQLGVYPASASVGPSSVDAASVAYPVARYSVASHGEHPIARMRNIL